MAKNLSFSMKLYILITGTIVHNFRRKVVLTDGLFHTVHVLITPNADLLQSAESIPVTAGTNDLQFQMIKLISVLTRFEEAWLSQHTQIVSIDICQGQWTN